MKIVYWCRARKIDQMNRTKSSGIFIWNIWFSIQNIKIKSYKAIGKAQ